MHKMRCLLAFPFWLSVLLIFSGKILVEAIDINGIQNDIDKFDMGCNQDKCGNQNHLTDSLSSRPCHCGKQCVQLGTCCLDSQYADLPQPKRKPTCRSVYNGEAYFIVDDCPSDSAWASLCNEEWNKDQDLLKLVPVTSNLTSITYKNYFCFRCHETHDKFLYWKLQIESDIFEPRTFNDITKCLDRRISFTYSYDLDTWVVTYEENIYANNFPVNISMHIPFNTHNLTQECERDVISTCHVEWSDKKMRNKCHSYMSIKEVEKYGRKLMYKNVHCAWCNYESSILCRRIGVNPYNRNVPFSLAYVMDINPSGGNRVGKKCADDEFWDGLSKKCRKPRCYSTGYEIKNNKCVQE